MIKGVLYDAEIEYLESTGMQWIDTGMILSSDGFSYNADVMFKTTDSCQVFGGRTQNSSSSLDSIVLFVDNSAWRFDYFGNCNIGPMIKANTRYSVSLANGKTTVNGIELSTPITAGRTSGATVYIFAGHCPQAPGGIEFQSSIRLYSLKFYKGGVLTADFQPVRVGQVGYIFDRVSKKLFQNLGTSDFVLGPDKARPVLSLHHYGASRFGKIGVGAKMMALLTVPASINDLATAVRAFGTDRESARALLCPQDFVVELPDTWTAENGTVYSNPQQVVDVDFMENEAGETLLYAICMPKYASAVTLAFDQRNQEPAVEATAQEGVDYYGFAAPHDPAHAYASGECCTHDGALYRASAVVAANTAWDSSKWTLQGYISADGTIPIYSENATYPANSIVRYTSTALGFTGMFKNSAAITVAGVFNPAKWSLFVVDAAEASFIKQDYSEGAALDYSGYAALLRTDLKVSSGNGIKTVLRYGYNNYKQSAQRQYFNNESDTPHGWFHQTHPGQIAPFGNIGQTVNSANSTNYGYRHGCSIELLRNVHAVKVPTWPNYITDGPNNISTVYHTLDTFWVPSGIQLVGSVNANEGDVFPGLLWQYIRALRVAGRKVVPYDATAEGEVGTVYVDTSNGQFYTYRPDITSGTKYSSFTNDDGSWFRDYRTRTVVECETNADRGKNTTTEVYFVTSTQKMYRCTNVPGSGTYYTEMSHEWYTYNAVGKPTSGISPLNGVRRSFSVTSHTTSIIRLRSALRSNSNYAWNCGINGTVNPSNAYAGYRVRPACAIR